jgi:hypothetical protein
MVRFRHVLAAAFLASLGACAAAPPRAPSTERGSAIVGAACSHDEDCATGVCWNVEQYSDCTGLAVCSLPCATDAECVQGVSKTNARWPDRARCGTDRRCMLDAVGLTGPASAQVCP